MKSLSYALIVKLDNAFPEESVNLPFSSKDIENLVLDTNYKVRLSTD
jgi:hypothetical protein